MEDKYKGIEEAGYKFSENEVPDNGLGQGRDLEQYLQKAKERLERYYNKISMNGDDLDETCLDLYEIPSDVDEILNSLLKAKDWEQYSEYRYKAYSLWDDLQTYPNSGSKLPLKVFMDRLQWILSCYKGIEKVQDQA